jgi:myosin-15
VAAAENGHVPAAAAVVGGGILVMKAADASAADCGSIRRPPKKIGQIRWPPVSDEIAKPKEPPKDIGRIQIEEGKEENHLVSPRAPPEEIQRRINEMIRAAREADAAGEVPKKRPLPPKPFKAAGDVTSDMKARQEQLEMQLTSMRKKKLDEDNAAAAAAVAAGVLATTVRPPPGGLLPPPPPPLPDEGPSFAAAHQQLEEHNRPPPRRESSHRQSVIASEIAFDLRSLDHKRTALYAQPTEPFLTYDRVPWTIEVRKEVFSPAEKLESPTLINMIFIQIVVDVANEDCIRIGKDDRVRMVNLLDRHGVNTRNVRGAHTAQVKRAVISAARALPVYFCRLFAVNGGRRNQRVHMVGVGHSGVRLLNRFKDTFDDVINVLVHLKYEEISEVFVARKSTVLLRTTSGQNHVVYTPKAVQLCHMIETYRAESNTLRDVKGRKDGGMMLNLNNINDTTDDESFAD